MNYLLYNRLADNGRGEENANKAKAALEEKGIKAELSCSNDQTLPEFFGSIKEEDCVILLGGDGTLNYFINNIGEKIPSNPLCLYPDGTGNDFGRDVENDPEISNGLIPLNKYLEHLPKVEVKGKTYRFINGIGYGIDGDCCVKAEEMKANGEEKIDYGSITVNLLLHSYVPKTARVKVDGIDLGEIKKVYLASAMNGRFYGGGMNIAPSQKRGSGKISLAMIHGKGKLGTLLMFPKLFKGTHIKKKKNVLIKEGKCIEVEFDKPTGLQIDGEVVRDVTSYKAWID